MNQCKSVALTTLTGISESLRHSNTMRHEIAINNDVEANFSLFSFSRFLYDDYLVLFAVVVLLVVVVVVAVVVFHHRHVFTLL